MQCTSEQALREALKNSPPAVGYLLYGKESYLVERYAAKAAEGFAGEGGLFNLLELDGHRLDLEALADAVYTLPMMAEKKCVVVKDLEPGKLSPGDQKELVGILEDLPDSCVLVMTGKDAFDPKSAVAKKLISALDGAGGLVARLDGLDRSGLTEFLKREAKKARCTVSSQLCRCILDLCGNDMHALRQEMAKVCAYAGAGEILREHIDAVVVPKTEARVFDLGKSIGAGNAQRALELLDGLFYQREQPASILAVLSMHYVDLYRARIAKDNGVTAGEAAARFGYKGKEFRMKNAFQACSNLSADFLRRALEDLLRCDRLMKSTGTDGRVLLEQTVVGLLAAGKAR